LQNEAIKKWCKKSHYVKGSKSRKHVKVVDNIYCWNFIKNNSLSKWILNDSNHQTQQFHQPKHSFFHTYLHTSRFNTLCIWIESKDIFSLGCYVMITTFHYFFSYTSVHNFTITSQLHYWSNSDWYELWNLWVQVVTHHKKPVHLFFSSGHVPTCLTLTNCIFSTQLQPFNGKHMFTQKETRPYLVTLCIRLLWSQHIVCTYGKRP
jgi:hypothetical protein